MADDVYEASRLAALTDELRRAETRGDAQRAKDVRAALARAGADGQTPAQRATKRKKSAAGDGGADDE